MRPFVDNVEPHALEHRQAVGKTDRLAQVEKLEAERTGCGFERSIKAHRQRLGCGQARHHLDVGYRFARGEILAVAGGKGVAELAEELVAPRLAQRLDQRLLQIVVPAPRRGDQPRFERTHVDVGNRARGRAHGDHDARQYRFGQIDIEFGARAVELPEQDLLPFLPQLGRVVLAGRIDQTRQEAFERIASHEQPEALPVAQVQYADGGAQQIVFGGLEQLIARIGLQDVDQGLAGMAAGLQAGACDDVGDLAPQQWDLRRIGAVRGRREESQETILAADLALCVEALDGDVVEIAGPVHGRARRRFGHD